MMVRRLAMLKIQTHLSDLKVKKFFNLNLLQYFKYDLFIISKQS